MSSEFDDINENIDEMEKLNNNNIKETTNETMDIEDNIIENDKAQINDNINKMDSTACPYTNIDDKNKQGKYKKKNHSFVKKFSALVVYAVLFGAIAGSTMIAVERNFPIKAKSGDVVIGKQDNDKKTDIESIEDKSQSKNVQNKIGDVSSIVTKAMPSVVAINAKSEVSAYTWFGRTQTYESDSSGSGIIIGKNNDELLMVTNNHVVENTNKLSVVFIDGNEVEATVKGSDSEADIAVIAVKLSDLKDETKKQIEVASIGDSSKLKVGEGVVAIGNALGYGQSVTVGYISALNRDVEVGDGIKRKLLQTDAAINPGNSGGALINSNGEIIGINSAKYSSTSVEGMGYAIPINDVQDLIKNLAKRQTRTKVAEKDQGYLGIQGQNIDIEMSKAYDMPRGVYVYKVIEGGASVKSELKEKDIITKLDSERVTSMQELKEALSYYKVGDKVKLTIQRLQGSEYKEQEIEITLGKLDKQEQN